MNYLYNVSWHSWIFECYVDTVQMASGKEVWLKFITSSMKYALTFIIVHIYSSKCKKQKAECELAIRKQRCMKHRGCFLLFGEQFETISHTK